MTPEEACELLRRVRYKPGWVFEITCAGLGHATWGAYCDMYHWAADATDPHLARQLRVGCHMYMYAAMLEGMDERAVLAHFRHHVLRHEEHELNEFLRLDGQCIVDPHPELRVA